MIDNREHTYTIITEVELTKQDIRFIEDHENVVFKTFIHTHKFYYIFKKNK